MKGLTALAVILVTASAVVGCQTLTGRPAGQHMKDKWLLQETKGRIAADNLRALTAVNVDVNRGTVYLIGTVGTAEQKARAEQIARRVDGVADVVTHLVVEAEAPSPARPSPDAVKR